MKNEIEENLLTKIEVWTTAMVDKNNDDPETFEYCTNKFIEAHINYVLFLMDIK